ncbi:phosphotransferase system enzyme I (PtsI) [Chthoniobacter flavus]|nr:phosphoenolpyruvate--protein phosphotransferase [Chthoniobacter flavus]TCO91505.1 phosphotransferase system enzyme I (PtsI) [Chthoniobacter flavus]
MSNDAAGPNQEKRFHGVGVSPGIARGTIFVYRPEDETPALRRIEEREIPEEIARFEAALIATRTQILEMQHRIAESIGAKDAGIFDAHLLVVEDRTLIDEVLRTLARDKTNVEYVFQNVAGRYAKTLSEIDDPYLRERALDIHDVTRRVVRNLMGKESRDLASVTTPHILIAHNLAPSDTAQLNRQLVLGFATDIGSKTSHTAIMARSLNIPAVVGLHDASSQLATGDHILLDGYNGLVIVNPSDQTLWEYGELEVKKTEVEEKLTQLRETVSTTLDGRHVTLSANIELPEDLEQVQLSGAEGVGLYRTEFFYIGKSELPSEEAQYKAYRKVAESVLPHSVIIRTLDLGGDKFMSALHMPEELNPFLGWRAIRFCLERVDIFKTQLRAMLRASAVGNVKIMYPMISGVDELRRANVILEECRQELRAEGKPFNEEMEVGAMIEIPSAAIAADILAREVDFFSIGTNDLIQYSIAVDRLNEHIAHLYEPTHPAIIRLIRMTVDAAHAHNLWVGVCGEMGGDIALTPLLLGLGVDELSTGAALVPRVKRAVQALDIAACLKLIEDIKCLDSADAILAKCEEVARAHYPELL